ncbi:MAG TPA: DUF72 domain-containing protein [Terriglobales bacterium]|nr:DUF72 domain-containing protein [Terriglobales bacterium]
MTPEIHLGTSSFTADGWNGAFYPKGMKSADYLRYYSSRFDTVEVDSTFYRCPTIEAVRNWALKTPPGFIFSLKVPQTITHQKILVECDEEFEEFVSTAQVLGEKLGPMVFQFPYFNKDTFSSPVQFLDRLKAFFKKLPRRDYKVGVEIRNKWWLTKRLTDLLKENNVALVLQDHSLMPSAEHVFSKVDPITADFVYIRLLGDRKAIEAKTTVWNQIVEDRTASMTSWVDVCQMVQRRGMPQYVYFNNHYEGFAVASVERFRRLCAEKGIETPLNVKVPAVIEPTLFDISPN